MPTRRDNADERLARLEALMEEYRIKHEDLEAYVRMIRTDARERRRKSQDAIQDAREQFNKNKRRKP